MPGVSLLLLLRLCVHVQVKMLRNSAVNFAGQGGDGGALQVVLAALTIKGNNNVFQDNTTDRNGGALSMEASVVLVEGGLCASGNKAAEVGGFASLIFGGNQLTFGYDPKVKFGDNFAKNVPNTLYLSPFGNPAPEVRCGDASSTPWASNETYTIIGKACACNSSFVANTSTTCDECGAPGWDQDTCSCVVSVLA
jgi:hypothetical protein